MSDRRLMDELKALEGKTIGKPSRARDPVNQPMIRHWCDAIGDRNPVYTDPGFAKRSIHGGVVAPPVMLQAWTMPGLVPPEVRAAATSGTMSALRGLDAAGFTSVVATNCTQEYTRYLKPGDHLTVTSTIEAVSEEKRTALGVGHFVTQRMIYTDDDGNEVATMRFRILKFRPTDREAQTPPTKRPRPRAAITQDNAFFWEGVENRKLLIQRCSCGKLRHPPGPMCPTCHSLEWDTVEASGRGSVYSFVVAHHPPTPAFEYPNLIVLVELEEGTRIVSNLVGVDLSKVRIGMPVSLEFAEVEPGRWLPQFRAEKG